jgi:ABC-2 type transport system ATP-binding protein
MGEAGTLASIVFDKVTKVYRKHFWTPQCTAVDNVGFSVEPGTSTGFVGPNGAGKTTSIKMMLGLVTPTQGTIRVLGESPQEPGSRKRIAYLSEQPYLYAHLTVLETCAFCCNLCGVADSAAEAARVLALVELDNVDSRPAGELSKGMQQRLSMACALIGNHDLYIFDEPMSGMDPPGRLGFRKLFRMLADQGKTILFSTHVLDDVATLCDRILVLSKGRLTYHGKVDELISRGNRGTEIIAGNVTARLKATLEQGGYCVSSEGQRTRIFVAPEANLSACQRLILSESADIESVTRLSKPLETLLYESTPAREAQ